MAGWAMLIAATLWNPAQSAARRTAQFILPALFALTYSLLLVQGWGRVDGAGFGTIAQVRALFSDDAMLTAGWLHYLAFDLFVGSWIVERGTAAGISALLLIPCLLLTFFWGPLGLLLFFCCHQLSRKEFA